VKVVENNFNIKFRNFFSTYLYMLKKSKNLLCLFCDTNPREPEQWLCKMCQNTPTTNKPIRNLPTAPEKKKIVLYF
jgi:hypothetical protein